MKFVDEDHFKHSRLLVKWITSLMGLLALLLQNFNSIYYVYIFICEIEMAVIFF